MTNINRIHGTTTDDLISIPGVMLGFRPTESLVVLGIGKDNTRILFCARLDADHAQQDREAMAQQINNACDRAEAGSLAVIGYSAAPTDMAVTIEALTTALDYPVTESLAVTPSRWWRVVGACIAGDGTPYTVETADLSLQAIVAGVSVAKDRAATVAQVYGPGEDHPELSELIEHHARAAALVEQMETTAQREATIELVSSETELTRAQAIHLAALLNIEEGAVVAEKLNRDNVASWRLRLIEARSLTPAAYANGVLGILGMACWLDKEGAQAVDCLTQIEKLNPGSGIGRILKMLLVKAVDPSNWEG